MDNRIRQELAQKASDAKPSDEMFSKIINRIEDYEGGKESMLKDKISYMFAKRWIAISLCAVLVLGGVMFTFSDEVRAATQDVVNTIKTIFVLDKTEDGYAIVEKTSQEPIFQPGCSSTSSLSDTELSQKMQFDIRFPETLYGGYKLRDKAESVVLRKLVSDETARQLEPEMFNAIKDEAAFEGLSDYNPFRSVFATYINDKGDTIFIGVQTSGAEPLNREVNTVEEINVGDINAAWYEVIYPNYAFVNHDGVGRSNIYKEPDGIIKKHFLTWESNGVRYKLDTYKELELTKKEAAQIAESFMQGQ